MSRQKNEQKDNGIIERTIIRAGYLSNGQSLLGGDKPQWSKSLLGRLDTKPQSKHYRVNEGFIEIGHHYKGNDEIIWEQELKLGAKHGDSWRSNALGIEKAYTLAFAKHKNRPAVTVTLVMAEPVSAKVVLTYVKGIGEVERISTSLKSGNTMATIILVEGSEALKE